MIYEVPTLYLEDMFGIEDKHDTKTRSYVQSFLYSQIITGVYVSSSPMLVSVLHILYGQFSVYKFSS